MRLLTLSKIVMDKRFFFVHGLGLSGSIWNHLAPLASEAEILIPDLPGHGLGPRGCYDFSEIWSYLEDHLSTDDWAQTIIVLHSMASALLPEINLSNTRPKAIVLVEGNLTQSDAKWSEQIIRRSENDYQKWFKIFSQSASTVLRTQLKTRQDEKDLIQFSEGFSLVDPSALRKIAAQTFSRSINGEIVNALKKIKVPTYYLLGELSEQLDKRALISEFNISIIVIPGSGHYPMIDNPLATWDAISSLN
jgi:pimeloyl-ACP methyl ester carboxylesterase